MRFRDLSSRGGRGLVRDSITTGNTWAAGATVHDYVMEFDNRASRATRVCTNVYPSLSHANRSLPVGLFCHDCSRGSLEDAPRGVERNPSSLDEKGPAFLLRQSATDRQNSILGSWNRARMCANYTNWPFTDSLAANIVMTHRNLHTPRTGLDPYRWVFVTLRPY